MSKTKTCLVTGGAGFIGSHVAKHLLDNGYRVVITDDLSGGFIENIPEGAIFQRISISDYGRLKKLFVDYRFDYVFHLAAYAAEGLSHFIRRFNYENNLVGSVNLINLSVLFGVEQFVFTSSIAVYGKNQLPMSEKGNPKPEDPYGVAKLAVELDLKAAQKIHGLNYTIFRPHNVYGERQNIKDPYRNVIGIFINRFLEGKPLPIFGDGKQTRAFSYISDVSPYISQSIEIRKAQNQIYNIGADTPYTVIEIANKISEIMGIKPKFKFFPAREEVKHAYSDHKKVKSAFRIKEFVELDEGLSRMIEWATTKKSFRKSRTPKIEILENMPNAWKRK
jgi:UDP-glucose 4-epimerase